MQRKEWEGAWNWNPGDSIRDICLFVDTSTIFSWHQKHTNSKFFETKIHKIQDFHTKHTNSHFFDKRLKMLTPALPVVPGTNLRYGWFEIRQRDKLWCRNHLPTSSSQKLGAIIATMEMMTTRTRNIITRVNIQMKGTTIWSTSAAWKTYTTKVIARGGRRQRAIWRTGKSRKPRNAVFDKSVPPSGKSAVAKKSGAEVGRAAVERRWDKRRLFDLLPQMGTCEDYVMPKKNESCCWRLTCPEKVMLALFDFQ